MEWLLLILAGGGGAFAARRLADRRATHRERREELDGVQRLADEDVTLFGEQLRRLDEEVGGRRLDTATRTDYQQALDAYEVAQREVPRLRDPEEVSKITDVLATGRYALACVQARVAGREVPALRVPCFFNPQHGPSVTDVVWTRPGRGTRTVPACAQDAARVAAREQPELRMVRIGARTVPYWEAGAAYLPYSRGYFPAVAYGTGAGGLGWAFDAPPDAHGPGGHSDHGGGSGTGISDSGGFGADFSADFGDVGGQ
ncbi:MAG TPA: hypothetical protein VFR87_09120 [Nocardioidaceae bacterium]|nr:hypothetical protein [Nocardioidaceae bacterium]